MPLIIDLFCGAGATSRGYELAGFDVIGVDLHPMKNYPYPFIQYDALRLDNRFLRKADAIHASPPCQAHTALRSAKHAKPHEDLIPPTRAMLIATGKPYVIENVEGAPLIDPVCLCGSMFGLGANTSDGTRYHLERHRLFETNWALTPSCECQHRQPVIGAYGAHVRNRSAEHGGRGTADFLGEDKPRLMRECMGIDYRQTMAEMSQAIPPAYTRYIGEGLMEFIR